MHAFIHHFLHPLGESLPLFLLGAAIGATVEVWMPSGWVERWLARGRGSVFLAATAGALLPGCAMSTMPLARALRARGLPVGTVATFIMIAPVLSPHTIAMTATLVSLPMAAARVLLAFVAASALGLVLNARRMNAPELVAEREDKSACCGGDATGGMPAPLSAWQRWLDRLLESLRELSPYLVIGLLVAAVLMALFPLEKYSAHLRSGWMAYVAVTLIAIPVYVCDGGEIPLTRALLSLGVGPGPAFCFMLASVGTCFATIAMAGRIIGWRASVIYLLAWLLLAIGGGVLVGAWLGA